MGKKPKHVQMADFDELFARGEARSALLESDNNMDPFKTTLESDNAQRTSTHFEIYGKETEFETSKRKEGIGYTEKVMSFLDDRENNPQITKDIMKEDEMSFKDITKNKEQSFDKFENKAHEKENKTSIKPDKSKQ